MYQALYRKYRPRDFDSLVGQDNITSVLKNQVNTGHVSHAYLFSGTRGTGKTSAAKIFARAVNCSQEYRPCNECSSCIESIEESSVDIIEIDAASNNGVDNIRDIRERAYYQPASLKYKVYIIDEVHMLSKGAFNALLKILEEPPEHLIFILATTEPERIPSTILSRVQKFQFNRISPDIIIKRLQDICTWENREIEDRVLRLIISRSDGSMRDALSILDQLFTMGFDEITYEDAIDTLGIVAESVLFDLVDSIVNNDGRWIDLLDDTLSSGKDISQLSSDLLEHFRRLMIGKVAPDSLGRYVYSDNQLYLDQSSKVSLDFIMNSMNILINMIKDSRFSQQKRALLDIAIFKILSEQLEGAPQEFSSLESQTNRQISNSVVVTNDSTIENNKEIRQESLKPVEDNELKKTQTEKIPSFEPRLEQPQEQDTKNTTEQVEKSTSGITLERIQKDWPQILTYLEKEGSAPMVAIIKQGSPINVKEKIVTIGFHKDNKRYIGMGDRYIPTIEKALNILYNKEDIKVNLEEINTSEDKDTDIQSDLDDFVNVMGGFVEFED